MSLELDSIEGLDDKVKGLFVQSGDKFVLDMDKIDPATELKTALDKEREESKKFKTKAQQLESAQSEAEKKRAKEKGEFESLYNNTQTELEAERKTNAEFRQSIQKKDINSAALKVAAGLTKDISRAELLQEKIAGMSRYTENGIKFELGGIEVDSAKVASHLSEKYPYLVDGNQSNGGGANGGQGSGAAKVISRTDFNAMNATDRMKFTKDGGTLTD